MIMIIIKLSSSSSLLLLSLLLLFYYFSFGIKCLLYCIRKKQMALIKRNTGNNTYQIRLQ